MLLISSLAAVDNVCNNTDTIGVTSTQSEYLQWDILQQVQCCAESNAISRLVSDTSTSGAALRIRWTEQSSELCSTTQRQQRYASQPGKSGQSTERMWSRWRERCTLALTRAACLKYYGVIFQAQHEVRWTLQTIKSWDYEDGSRRTFTFRAKQALFY